MLHGGNNSLSRCLAWQKIGIYTTRWVCRARATTPCWARRRGTCATREEACVYACREALCYVFVRLITASVPPALEYFPQQLKCAPPSLRRSELARRSLAGWRRREDSSKAARISTVMDTGRDGEGAMTRHRQRTESWRGRASAFRVTLRSSWTATVGGERLAGEVCAHSGCYFLSVPFRTIGGGQISWLVGYLVVRSIDMLVVQPIVVKNTVVIRWETLYIER